MPSEARQKKIMSQKKKKENRAQRCSILGPQNLGSRGGPGPRGPPWIRAWKQWDLTCIYVHFLQFYLIRLHWIKLPVILYLWPFGSSVQYNTFETLLWYRFNEDMQPYLELQNNSHRNYSFLVVFLIFKMVYDFFWNTISNVYIYVLKIN